MDADSSSKFISSLTKFLQSLCNGYVEFQRGVELVGHIYLNIDTGEKVDYILHEKVNKNDENSVTFVSNSFHAQPQDKPGSQKDAPSKPGHKDSDDDDDIMIVDHSKDTPGSTNYGTIPSRGMKHASSSSNFDKRSDGSNPLSSPQRNRQHSGRPSATVTSQSSQENININEVKLEQISSDELLSLASQVDGGDSGSNFPDMQSQSGGSGRIGRRAFSDTSGQPVWIKQEPSDDTHGGPDTGWSQSGDGQSDSSNSSSNIYPMMMHQNPAAFPSNPVFPGFSSTSASQGFPRSGPGGSGAANLYANPMPGTSQSMDPADLPPSVLRGPNPSYGRQQLQMQMQSERWLKVKRDPVRYARWKAQARASMRKSRMKKKLMTLTGGQVTFAEGLDGFQLENSQFENSPFESHSWTEGRGQEDQRPPTSHWEQQQEEA